MTGGGLVRSVTRPMRRALRVFATSDPDRSRLRLAVTTIVTLAVVANVLFVGATLAGAQITAVIPGIILAMLSCLAIREPRSGVRAVTIPLLVPTAFASITVASLLNGFPLIADAAFVAVAVVAVLLRVFGPRGTALGMVAFMSYFLALFVKITVSLLPIVAGALLVAALVAIGIGLLLRPRHPERDLRLMLTALGDRTGRVVLALDEAVGDDDTDLDERLRRTIASRVTASSATASSVEQALESAERPLVDGVGNDELGVRVFDLQLTLEHLVATILRLLAKGDLGPADRDAISARLVDLAGHLRTPLDATAVGADRPSRVEGPALDHGDPLARAERLARLDRILTFAGDAWANLTSPSSAPRQGDDDSPTADARTADPSAADASAPEDSVSDDAPSPGDARREKLRSLWRQAVQVAVAAALAIAAGTAISSSRWFWAVIAAFVVYIGTSSRGEILSKGWLRVVGTLGGVVVGVLIAALVGGNTVVAIALIVVCLFLGVYLMSVSSAFMIFFITTMLALLYGLLGEFSIGLLATRLGETAVGAAIGVGVAYTILPTRTRDVARDRLSEFLDRLADAVAASADRLGARSFDDLDGPETKIEPPTAGRALRNAWNDLRGAVKPLTEGIAGIADRSGSRRTMQIVAACEYHGRALLRLSDTSPDVVDDEEARRLLAEASETVRRNVELLKEALSGRFSDITLTPADSRLDTFDARASALGSDGRVVLAATSRNLRAIDRSICTRAEELGATLAD